MYYALALRSLRNGNRPEQPFAAFRTDNPSGKGRTNPGEEGVPAIKRRVIDRVVQTCFSGESVLASSVFSLPDRRRVVVKTSAFAAEFRPPRKIRFAEFAFFHHTQSYIYIYKYTRTHYIVFHLRDPPRSNLRPSSS